MLVCTLYMHNHVLYMYPAVMRLTKPTLVAAVPVLGEPWDMLGELQNTAVLWDTEYPGEPLLDPVLIIHLG